MHFQLRLREGNLDVALDLIPRLFRYLISHLGRHIRVWTDTRCRFNRLSPTVRVFRHTVFKNGGGHSLSPTLVAADLEHISTQELELTHLFAGPHQTRGTLRHSRMLSSPRYIPYSCFRDDMKALKSQDGDGDPRLPERPPSGWYLYHPVPHLAG